MQLAAMAAGLMAAVGQGAAAVVKMADANAPRAIKTETFSATVGSSRNGGQRGSNRRQQRIAQKRRNVRRNRLAHRG